MSTQLTGTGFNPVLASLMNSATPLQLNRQLFIGFTRPIKGESLW